MRLEKEIYNGHSDPQQLTQKVRNMIGIFYMHLSKTREIALKWSENVLQYNIHIPWLILVVKNA